MNLILYPLCSTPGSTSDLKRGLGSHESTTFEATRAIPRICFYEISVETSVISTLLLENQLTILHRTIHSINGKSSLTTLTAGFVRPVPLSSCAVEYCTERQFAVHVMLRWDGPACFSAFYSRSSIILLYSIEYFFQSYHLFQSALT